MNDMKHRSLFLTLLLALVCPAWSDPVPSNPPEPVVQAVGDTYDFGSRSALDQSLVTHTFVLKAGTKAGVTVDRLQPSCHCTEATPVGGTDGYGRFKIVAGEAAKIAVTFNPGDVAPGDVEKEVYVFVNGHSTPEVTLHIRGVIRPPVAFSVPVLDFGRIPVGEARTLKVSVTYDPSLLTAGQTVSLACSDPRLHLVRDYSPLPAYATPTRELRYQITLPVGINPGMLSGTLFLSLTPNGTKETSWSIPVRGEIVTRTAGN